MTLKDKKILICISGGIAVYKVCELTRMLIKQGAVPRVIMTQSATKFVSPLTFETLTNFQVHHTMFPDHFIGTRHIDLADWADLLVIVPATANVIGKLANGLSDDLLTTVVCAATVPKLIAPAMNTNMWTNSIVQENISKLVRHGFAVMGTSTGELACGWVGEGRLADPDDIIQYMYASLSAKPLLGKKILISSGATIEDIDPVRFLSNRSTGKMGNALAYAAWSLGADVTLVSGENAEPAPAQIRERRVRSAKQMAETIQQEASLTDIYISAAAIADFTPAAVAVEKVKKTGEFLTLELRRTEDVLSSLKKRSGQLFIGFAVETENAEKNAVDKLKRKNLDAIFLNNPKSKGAAFGHATNTGTLFKKDGSQVEFGLQSKRELAFGILSNL
jgi:phosphopantothenoylcysteine decarboxylase/phosphopantothenate--cysteine ligase